MEEEVALAREEATAARQVRESYTTLGCADDPTFVKREHVPLLA